MAIDDCRSLDDSAGGLGAQCGEMLGVFLCQRRHCRGVGLRVASECAQLSHRSLLVVWARCKRCKVSSNDVPTWSTTVRHVRGGDGVGMYGFGASYRERLRRRIACPECGIELTDGSMPEHHRRMHMTEPVICWNWLLVSQMEHLPQVYDVSFPKGTTQCPCLFP